MYSKTFFSAVIFFSSGGIFSVYHPQSSYMKLSVSAPDKEVGCCCFRFKVFIRLYFSLYNKYLSWVYGVYRKICQEGH